jgi:hypothetical protein
MYLKIHPTPKGDVIAVCDAALIGQVLADGKRRLDLALHANFYQGKKVTHRVAVAALRNAANANLVGKKAIAAAESAGIDTSCMVEISGVPHLQLYQV